MRDIRVLLLGALLLAACGGDDEGDTGAANAAQASADSTAAASLLTPVRAASMAEVEFADMATQRAASPAIRQYARTVAADHRALIAALDSVARLSRAALTETGESHETANTIRMAHSGLDGVAGPDFDLPFIRAEVESHRLLVDQLDNQLIPSAQQANLQSLLNDIRAMVDAHLTRARQLLASQLGESAAPSPPARPPVQSPPPVQTVPPPPQRP